MRLVQVNLGKNLEHGTAAGRHHSHVAARRHVAIHALEHVAGEPAQLGEVFVVQTGSRKRIVLADRDDTAHSPSSVSGPFTLR